jgi:hypothetical protein
MGFTKYPTAGKEQYCSVDAEIDRKVAKKIS